jgi:hypothetical protein
MSGLMLLALWRRQAQDMEARPESHIILITIWKRKTLVEGVLDKGLPFLTSHNKILDYFNKTEYTPF